MNELVRQRGVVYISGLHASSQSVSFSILSTVDHKLAILDLTKMSTPDEVKHLEKDNWYYFNRINVPDQFIPQNASILLYSAMEHWADQYHANIYNDILPYPNSKLSADQIKLVESLYGFQSLFEIQQSDCHAKLTNK